jgi:hypothetical protein
VVKNVSKAFSEILRRAVDGERDAINEILLLYAPLIDRNSFVDGTFDEDCRQYIMLRIVKQLPKFRGHKNAGR